MKYKVLWIEDGAFVEVSNFAGPVLISKKYDLQVALNASDAVKKIKTTEFDAVVVDIRIPPGDDPEWETLYIKSRHSKIEARLGIEILFGLLSPKDSAIKIADIPHWVSPKKFGIFTVESEDGLKKELNELGGILFKQKKTNMSNSALLDLIEEIIGSSEQATKKGGN
ncbi:MAG: hypothetical protein KAW12_24475 [Candidatus Aminicenantes bacterium]|nr:hypothetical protein [Candidatus Aminicenantes bacterium]